jgi:hypothetical protein
MRKQHSTASSLRLGGGNPCNKKRKKSDCPDPAPPSSGTGATTAAELEKLLDTCTDTRFVGVIHDLPENWQAHNLKGNIITKRMLRKTAWGAYRDDHSILTFQEVIMSTKPHPQTIAKYDTQMALSIIQHNDVWTRRINNPLTNWQLLHPLQNPITIMQVYHAQHYITLITNTKIHITITTAYHSQSHPQ